MYRSFESLDIELKICSRSRIMVTRKVETRAPMPAKLLRPRTSQHLHPQALHINRNTIQTRPLTSNSNPNTPTIRHPPTLPRPMALLPSSTPMVALPRHNSKRTLAPSLQISRLHSVLLPPANLHMAVRLLLNTNNRSTLPRLHPSSTTITLAASRVSNNTLAISHGPKEATISSAARTRAAFLGTPLPRSSNMGSSQADRVCLAAGQTGVDGK